MKIKQALSKIFLPVTPIIFIFILMACTSVTIALVSLQNTKWVNLHLQDKNAPSVSYDLTEPLQKIDQLTQQMQAKIARMDEIIREYERISEENRTFAAQLHDFGEVMDEVGSREQEKYMEGRK
jgi:uncharacterized protein YoxC